MEGIAIALVVLVIFIGVPALIVLGIINEKRREKGKPPIFSLTSSVTSATGTPSKPNESSATGIAIGLAFVGGFIGGLIGFLLRPAAPFIGQLPFETVISRGGNLRGLDQILISTAETSFNYMLVGAIIGGVGGVITGLLLKRGRQVHVVATAPAENKIQFQSTPMIPKQVELNQSPEQVVNVLGQPEKTVNLGAKVIYVYKDMKIVFMDGKVSDVQ